MHSYIPPSRRSQSSLYTIIKCCIRVIRVYQTTPPPPLNRGDEIRRRVAEHREMVLLSCVAVFPAARDHDLPRFLSCPQILRHTVYIWKVKHHVSNIWNKGSLVMWSCFSAFSVCLTCCREGEDRGLAFPDPLPTHPLMIIGQFAFRTIFMCFRLFSKIILTFHFAVLFLYCAIQSIPASKFLETPQKP